MKKVQTPLKSPRNILVDMYQLKNIEHKTWYK